MASRRVVPVPFAGLGIDTTARLTRDQYAAIRALGIVFAGRYLGDLTSEEIDDAHAAGVGILPVQHAHAAGWQPTGALGREDGTRAVQDARGAGIPCMPLWNDLEGCHPASNEDEIATYAAGWASALRVAGYEPRVYVGAGVPGDGLTLYALPYVGYWKSQSIVPTPARRGYQLVQLFRYPQGQCQLGDAFPDAPPAVKHLLVDVDVATTDYLGGRPAMLVAAPATA